MKKVCIFFIGILYFVCLCAQSFKYENIAVHPRLLWPLGGSEAIKEAMAEYPQLASVHERILRECTAMFFQEPVECILAVSYTHLGDVYKRQRMYFRGEALIGSISHGV